MSARFRAALGRGGTFEAALDQALPALGPADRERDRDRIGIVHVDDPLSDALDAIVADLVRRTGVETWFGAASSGVFSGSGASLGTGGAALLITPWTRERVHFIGAGAAPPPASGTAGGRQLALVQGDAGLRDGPSDRMLRVAGGAFALGGITASGRSPMQMLDGPAEGDVGGLLLDPATEALAGISQGCTPIGPMHAVSAAGGPWIGALDGRPAFAVLREEMGEILARQPDRVPGYIQVALPAGGTADEPFRVRPILALEPRRGEIATAEALRRGDRLCFVKRDASAARHSLEAMLGRLAGDLGGRRPKGAVYVASSARLTSLFEDPASELRIIQDRLGPMPLIGFLSNGEIFDDRLHDWSSVLALFP